MKYIHRCAWCEQKEEEEVANPGEPWPVYPGGYKLMRSGARWYEFCSRPCLVAFVLSGREPVTIEPHRHRALMFKLIQEARQEQDDKFGWIGAEGSYLPGEDNHRKLTVLVEEVGEVARAILDLERKPLSFNAEAVQAAIRKKFLAQLHEELMQVAACAVAWVEADYEKGNVE